MTQHNMVRHNREPMRTRFNALAICLLLSSTLFAAPPERRVTQLAEGVYSIEHASRGGSASGNTTVIIGARQVLVVDSCIVPSAAREDIAQIRQWTNKPVAYVVNTHFHNDHNNGNSTYLDAFPNAAVVAHEETKKDMDLIQPGNIERIPAQQAAVIATFKGGKDQSGRTLTEEEMKEVRETILPRLEQRAADFRAVVYQSPTLTFRDQFTVDLGNREVQVMHLGRGNTPGDAVVYLPKERILAAGDLLVSPIPYTFDGYPSEWSQTLRRMARLDIEKIVPGHGPVFQGKDYLYLVADLLTSAVDQVRARIRNLGHPGFHKVEEVKDFVDLSPFRSRFAGDDKALQTQFDQMTADLVRIVFNEAAQR